MEYKEYDKKNIMTIIYDNKYKEEKIRIFGEEFVKNNKDKCMLLIILIFLYVINFIYKKYYNNYLKMKLLNLKNFILMEIKKKK